MYLCVMLRVFRWFQAPGGTTLFHVTKDPLEPSEFEEAVDDEGNIITRWGRSAEIEVSDTPPPQHRVSDST